MNIKDYTTNTFLKARFCIYRHLYSKGVLKSISPFISSSPAIKAGWQLVFVDNFEAVSWFRNETPGRSWGIGEHWGWFHPDNGRSWWGEPMLKEPGTLSIKTRYNPHTFYLKNNYWHYDPVEDAEDTKLVPFECSGLSTGHKQEDKPLFSQQYGRWECRCKVPINSNIRSAYWMWGSTWPPEIDVFEVDGDEGKQKINIHYGVNEGGSHPAVGSWRINTFNGEFQEFAMEWSPKKIEIFVDGIKVYKFTKKNILSWLNDDVAKMWVLVYQAVIGDINTTSLEVGQVMSEMLVDYVRVYEKV